MKEARAVQFLRRVSLPVVIVLLVSVASCRDIEKTVETLEKQSREWQQKFEEATAELGKVREQVDILGRQMIVAADSLDPLAIKELYRNNKTLTDINQKLSKALTDAHSPGTPVEGPASQVLFEIMDYVGSLQIQAWVGREDNNYFFDIRLENGTLPLPITTNIAATRVHEIASSTFNAHSSKKNRFVDASSLRCSSPMGSGSSVVAAHAMYNRRGEIDAEYKKQIGIAWENYLQSAATIPTPGKGRQEFGLGQRLKIDGQAGFLDRTLNVRIKPLALHQGKWRLSYRVHMKKSGSASAEPAFIVKDKQGTSLDPVTDVNNFSVTIAKEP